MAYVLYIEASPRKDRSASIEVARMFLSAYQQAHLQDTVETLDLWKTDLPEIDGEVINAKYAILHGLDHTEAERQAWTAVERLISQFTWADKYLFSLPMWNFGIPYPLKHYIDVLVQPGYTFSYTPEEGFRGLVTGKPVAAVYARGSAYYPGSGLEDFDFQKTYLERILGFIGITDFRPIIIEPTLSSPEQKQKALDAAGKQARAMAAEF